MSLGACDYSAVCTADDPKQSNQKSHTVSHLALQFYHLCRFWDLLPGIAAQKVSVSLSLLNS